MAAPAGNPGGNGPWNPWQIFNFIKKVVKKAMPALEGEIARAESQLSQHDRDLVNRILREQKESDDRRSQAEEALRSRMVAQRSTAQDREGLENGLGDPSVPHDDIGEEPTGPSRFTPAPNIMAPDPASPPTVSQETLRQAAVMIQLLAFAEYRKPK